MNYKKHIGDGKLPNRYWVFHYDEKFTKNEDGDINDIGVTETGEGGLLGEFKTYQEALECVNNKAYYPHVFIEDRITGMVFESQVIVCPCCNKGDYETIDDIKFTREFIEKRGFTFK